MLPSKSRLKEYASLISIAVAVMLLFVKVAAWLLTGSVAMLTSAVDAVVDVGASVVTYVGVRYAERPPDRQHRFGYEKGEAIAAFTQAAMLAGAALVLTFQAGQRLLYPEAIESLDIGVAIVLGSLMTAAALATMQTWLVAKTGSTAIAADRAHYMTDVAVNAAVLLALAVTKVTGWNRADPCFALLIALYMLVNARIIATNALAQLLDRELPTAERRRIRTAVRACAGVRAIHDLRTRSSGDRTFVEYHLEVSGDLTVAQGHSIADDTEIAVESLFASTVEASAHLEPFGIVDQRRDERLARASMHTRLER